MIPLSSRPSPCQGVYLVTSRHRYNPQSDVPNLRNKPQIRVSKKGQGQRKTILTYRRINTTQGHVLALSSQPPSISFLMGSAMIGLVTESRGEQEHGP